MYYEPRDLTLERITESFCHYFNVKYQKITMPKFVKILSACWKAKVDMNFDYNPDFEDLDYYRNTDFMKCVLYQISQHYFSGSFDNRREIWYNEIRKVLGGK